MLAGVKTIQKCIVVRNNLLERECSCISRHVTVGSEDDIIAKANGAAHGRINAVLRHTSADHKASDASGRKVCTKSRLKKRVASAFVDYGFGRLGGNLSSKRPP